MNQKERTEKLVAIFESMGYTHDYPQGAGRWKGASNPSNCSTGILFRPADVPKGKPGYRFQMFRGYVHDDEDIIYLRVNVPGVVHGLGQKCYPLDPNDDDFAEQVATFCELTTAHKETTIEMETLQCRISSMTKRREIVECSACDGTKIMTSFDRPYPCKVCNEKGKRVKITYTGYEWLEDEE